MLTHWKRLWCWEGLGVGGKGDDRGWDGWMASPTRRTWVWVKSSSWWWTGRPGVLWFMGSQRVGHDWATELNWYDLVIPIFGAYSEKMKTGYQKDIYAAMFVKVSSVMSDCLPSPGLYSSCNFPGQKTRMGSSSLLQEIFPIQELIRGLLYCRRIL